MLYGIKRDDGMYLTLDASTTELLRWCWGLKHEAARFSDRNHALVLLRQLRMEWSYKTTLVRWGSK